MCQIISLHERSFKDCEHIIEAQERNMMITRYIIGAIAGAVIGGVVGYVGKCYGST